jgi:hypothetical protein
MRFTIDLWGLRSMQRRVLNSRKVVAVDETIDPSKQKRLVPDIQLLEAGKTRPDDDVALLEVLRRARPKCERRPETVSSFVPERFEP